jgi:hypothetical protein
MRCTKRRGLNGLVTKSLAPEPLEATEFAGKGGEHEDGKARGGGIAPEDFANCKAVELGHHDIKDDEIRFERVGLFNGIDAIAGGANGKTGLLEIETDEFDQFGIVVRHKYLFSRNGFYHKGVRAQ